MNMFWKQIVGKDTGKYKVLKSFGTSDSLEGLSLLEKPYS